VPGARRSLPGPTRRATSSAAPGSATRASENQRQGQRQRQRQRQRRSPIRPRFPVTVTVPGHRPRTPISATDRTDSVYQILRVTGLPSRSALVAPPLRLAALRWREAPVFLGRFRPPSGVSTAFLVAVARFSKARSPRVPPLRMCTFLLEASAAHSQGRHARRCAPIRSPERACGSRAPLKEKRPTFARRATGGCPAPVPRVPGVGRRRYASSRAQQSTGFSCPGVHEKGRNGNA
jgi:hypothetical protein